MFKIYRQIRSSTLIDLDVGGQGDNWILIRQPESMFVVGDGPQVVETLDRLFTRIKEFFYSYPVCTDASFEFRFYKNTYQVRREYILEHGFDPATNEALRDFVEYFKSPHIVPPKEQDETQLYSPYVSSGRVREAYKEEPHKRLDPTLFDTDATTNN
jgi:hypothetical protein